MGCFNKIFKLVGMSLVMTMAACKQSITMKTLILATSQMDSQPIFEHMQSYGIPYDYMEFSPSTVFKGNITLYNENNEPKYNLIVINGGNLIFERNGLWVSALTAKQWANIDEYERNNSIRRVVISDDVSSNVNVELNDPNNWGDTFENQPVIFEQSEEIVKVFNDARIKLTAPLNVDNIYHTRVKIVNTANTKPFLYYSDNGEKGPVGGIITKYDDGREEMSFFFGLGSWSQSSIIFSHLYLTWGTRSLFNGFRRVYFTPHIDDVFLGTQLADPKSGSTYGSENFRTGPKDFEKIAQFQKDVLEIMPEGSFYRVEMAFNGNGILISGDYEQSLKVDTNRYGDIEFVKEPGTGDKRWPSENYQFSEEQYATMEKDIVFNYFNHNDTAQKEFFWSSHTFTHENLDNVSRSDADNEIRLNIEMAHLLGLLDTDYWSPGAIITPQISGLHNKDALDIFKLYGIKYGTGDLSRPALCNAENPYLPYYTTMESSNYEGFPIIPRSPTEVYYYCSTREEDLWVYNEIYRDYYGGDSTFDQLLERESERTLLLMLKLRHEAHQFHQANIRYYPKEGKYGESLLEDWTRSVVNLYTKYVDWPLISLKIEKHAETYHERAKLETCGHETKFIIKNNLITGISVSASSGDCKVPITVPGGVNKSSLPAGATLEQVGKDPLTVWIPLKKGETKSFQLEPALEWNAVESFESTTEVETSTVVSTTTVMDETTTIVDETTTIVDETTTIANESTTVANESTIVDVPTTTIVNESTIVVVPTTIVNESTIVDVPTTTIANESTVVVVPTTIINESTVVDDPTTSVANESTVVVVPTTIVNESTIVDVPTTTIANESTVVVVPTTIVNESTVVDDPTTSVANESTIVVVPTTIVNESTIVDVPTTTIANESTVIVVPTTIVNESTVVENPTTTIVENPTTSVVENPTTSVAENPTTSVAENPTTSVVENPTTSVAENPTTSVVENPTTTIVENPTTSVAENPTTSVVENPTTTIVENPTTTIVENPTTTIVENPTTSVVENPTTTIVENPTTSVVENPTTTIVENPTTIVVENPTTSVVENPTTTTVENPTEVQVSECRNSGYAQCGGYGFNGANCCPEGFYCKNFNPYYSQCVLNGTYVETTDAEQPTPVASCDNIRYGQCGGIGYTGPTCCTLGFVCTVQSEYYHQCLPK